VTRRREIRKLCENFAACEKSAILDEIIGPVNNSLLHPHSSLTDSTLSEQSTRGINSEDPAWYPCEMPNKHYESYRQQKRYIENEVIIQILKKLQLDFFEKINIFH
jgi:hypothetical protein